MKRKTLVITGASRGIGFATASLFMEKGYGVINISRSSIKLPGAIQLTADLASASWPDEIGDHLSAVLRESESITLIHNASSLQKDTIENLSQESLFKGFNVSVGAAVVLNQLVLPFMNVGSSILYVGSTLSEQGVANSCSYVIAKHAVVGLMRATVQDLAGKGIHSACICPGFTDTEMLRAHVGGEIETIKDISSKVTFNRLVHPAEIAKTLYFASKSPAINGALMHVNLGQVGF